MSQPGAAYRIVLLVICTFVTTAQVSWISGSALSEFCRDAFVSHPNNSLVMQQASSRSFSLHA